MSNLRMSNGRSVISQLVELLIQSDVSKASWGPFCPKTLIRGVWYQAEQSLHVNILELRATKFSILNFADTKRIYQSMCKRTIKQH